MLGASAGVGSAIFLPYSVCGAVSFTAGALVLLTPETLGKDMPEGMEVRAVVQPACLKGNWRASDPAKMMTVLGRACLAFGLCVCACALLGLPVCSFLGGAVCLTLSVLGCCARCRIVQVSVSMLLQGCLQTQSSAC